MRKVRHYVISVIIKKVSLYPRQLRHLTSAILLCVLLCHTFPMTSASATPMWMDGAPHENITTNCVNNNNQQEIGTSSYVGYWGEPNLSTPWVNAVYSLHLVIAQIGNPCVTAGSHSFVEIFLPSNVSLAISPTNPVVCWYGNIGGPYEKLIDCPQTFVGGPNNGLAYRSPNPDGRWILAHGKLVEFWIPVRSTTTLQGPLFNARVEALDGNSPNPVLSPNAPLWVAQAPIPTIQNPSTTDIKINTARTHATLENHYMAGDAYWDIGTTTSYTYSSSPFKIMSTSNSVYLWTDWAGLSAETEYHWRLRFVTASGATYTGPDQTFKTLPPLKKIHQPFDLCHFVPWC